MAGPAAGKSRSGWRRALGRLTSAPSDLESDDLRETSARLGGTPICDLRDRELACVSGTVRSVSVRPRADETPALVVDLDDGSRTLRLVWLGRRQIAGIEPGRFLVARGRVCLNREVPTIFNPAYELRDADDL